jgi:hypothetical protein
LHLKRLGELRSDVKKRVANYPGGRGTDSHGNDSTILLILQPDCGIDSESAVWTYSSMLGLHVHAPVLSHLQMASHSYPLLEMAGARSHPEET